MTLTEVITQNINSVSDRLCDHVDRLCDHVIYYWRARP